jgi:Holliday junction resolvase-like predicted endonuclease
MNDMFSALRTAAIKRAEQVLEGQKLQVLDRDWNHGEHHLDLVATPGSDILAAVEVRIVTQGTMGACVVTLTEARFWQATDAVRAWMRQHEAVYNDVWVILVSVDPVSGVEVVTGSAATGVA